MSKQQLEISEGLLIATHVEKDNGTCLLRH